MPAGAAFEYAANQKTLATFSASAKGLTSLQRTQVNQAVEDNVYAQKFIRTGIRLDGQPLSMNLAVRRQTKGVLRL